MNGSGVSGCTVSAFTVALGPEFRLTVRTVGPAIDAFGISRIIFGTSPSPSSSSASTAHDWYVLAREVVAEIGIDQEGVDAIFGGNAKVVYGA